MFVLKGTVSLRVGGARPSSRPQSTTRTPPFALPQITE